MKKNKSIAPKTKSMTKEEEIAWRKKDAEKMEQRYGVNADEFLLNLAENELIFGKDFAHKEAMRALGNLSNKVVPANEIPVPEPKMTTTSGILGWAKENGTLMSEGLIEYVETNGKTLIVAEIQAVEAGKAILEFCKANKTDFDSLSSWLVENYGKPTKAKKEAKNSLKTDIPVKASKFTSDWRKQFIASKTGIKG